MLVYFTQAYFFYIFNKRFDSTDLHTHSTYIHERMHLHAHRRQIRIIGRLFDRNRLILQSDRLTNTNNVITITSSYNFLYISSPRFTRHTSIDTAVASLVGNLITKRQWRIQRGQSGHGSHP